MVKKLLHTRMRVNDIERTVKFYAEALELKIARRSTSPRGAQIVFLATPNSDEEIEICQMPPGAPAVVVQPLGSSAWLVVGGWAPRCFSRADLVWIEGWARRLTARWAQELDGGPLEHSPDALAAGTGSPPDPLEP
jgi:catechol 2,3-dioxygenase-like lactoylglutathione lyase family enzyme